MKEFTLIRRHKLWLLDLVIFNKLRSVRGSSYRPKGVRHHDTNLSTAYKDLVISVIFCEEEK